MRTYETDTKNERVVSRKRTVLYACALGVGVLAIATVVTLAILFSGAESALLEESPLIDTTVDVVAPTVDDEEDDEDTDVSADVATEITFVLPMETFTVGQLCSLDQLVYNSSMNQYATHNGMDFLCDEGTEVFSIADGTVLSVTVTELDATVIIIEHDGGYTSTYKGLNSETSVTDGDTVSAGDVIGTVASSMPRERSEGPHLHLEVTLDGELIDPLTVLPEVGDK